MLLFQFLACAVGSGAGFIAAGLSVAGSRRLGDVGFGRQLGAFGRLLLSPEAEDRLLQEYWRLWPVLLAFTVNKLALGLVTLVPVALGFGGLTLLEAVLSDTRVIGAGDGNAAWDHTSGWHFPFFAALSLASLVTWLAARYKA